MLKNEENIAIWVFGAVGTVLAIEKWYKHATYGNGIRALVAIVGFAA